MSNLLYLVIAVVLSLLGSLVLYMRARQPRSMEAGMEQFARGLRALAPEPRAERDGERSERGRHR